MDRLFAYGFPVYFIGGGWDMRLPILCFFSVFNSCFRIFNDIFSFYRENRVFTYDFLLLLYREERGLPLILAIFLLAFMIFNDILTVFIGGSSVCLWFSTIFHRGRMGMRLPMLLFSVYFNSCFRIFNDIFQFL